MREKRDGRKCKDARCQCGRSGREIVRLLSFKLSKATDTQGCRFSAGSKRVSNEQKLDEGMLIMENVSRGCVKINGAKCLYENATRFSKTFYAGACKIRENRVFVYGWHT